MIDIHLVDDGQNSNGINLKFIFKANQYFNETSAVRRLKFSEGQPVCIEGELLTPKGGNWLTHESKKVTNKSTG